MKFKNLVVNLSIASVIILPVISTVSAATNDQEPFYYTVRNLVDPNGELIRFKTYDEAKTFIANHLITRTDWASAYGNPAQRDDQADAFIDSRYINEVPGSLTTDSNGVIVAPITINNNAATVYKKFDGTATGDKQAAIDSFLSEVQEVIPTPFDPNVPANTLVTNDTLENHGIIYRFSDVDDLNNPTYDTGVTPANLNDGNFVWQDNAQYELSNNNDIYYLAADNPDNPNHTVLEVAPTPIAPGVAFQSADTLNYNSQIYTYYEAQDLQNPTRTGTPAPSLFASDIELLENKIITIDGDQYTGSYVNIPTNNPYEYGKKLKYRFLSSIPSASDVSPPVAENIFDGQNANWRYDAYDIDLPRDVNFPLKVELDNLRDGSNVNSPIYHPSFIFTDETDVFSASNHADQFNNSYGALVWPISSPTDFSGGYTNNNRPPTWETSNRPWDSAVISARQEGSMYARIINHNTLRIWFLNEDLTTLTVNHDGSNWDANGQYSTKLNPATFVNKNFIYANGSNQGTSVSFAELGNNYVENGNVVFNPILTTTTDSNVIASEPDPSIAVINQQDDSSTLFLLSQPLDLTKDFTVNFEQYRSGSNRPGDIGGSHQDFSVNLTVANNHSATDSWRSLLAPSDSGFSLTAIPSSVNPLESQYLKLTWTNPPISSAFWGYYFAVSKFTRLTIVDPYDGAVPDNNVENFGSYPLDASQESFVTLGKLAGDLAWTSATQPDVSATLPAHVYAADINLQGTAGLDFTTDANLAYGAPRGTPGWYSPSDDLLQAPPSMIFQTNLANRASFTYTSVSTEGADYVPPQNGQPGWFTKSGNTYTLTTDPPAVSPIYATATSNIYTSIAANGSGYRAPGTYDGTAAWYRVESNSTLGPSFTPTSDIYNTLNTNIGGSRALTLDPHLASGYVAPGWMNNALPGVIFHTSAEASASAVGTLEQKIVDSNTFVEGADFVTTPEVVANEVFYLGTILGDDANKYFALLPLARLYAQNFYFKINYNAIQVDGKEIFVAVTDAAHYEDIFDQAIVEHVNDESPIIDSDIADEKNYHLAIWLVAGSFTLITLIWWLIWWRYHDLRI